MNTILVFPYKSQWRASLYTFLAFAGGTAFFVYKALHNDKGILYKHLIEFSQSGATTFYWVMAGFSFVIALLGIVNLVAFSMYGKKSVLRLTDMEIYIPRWPRIDKSRIIPFTDIDRLGLEEIHGQRFLVLKCRSIGTLKIAQSLLSNPEDFTQLCNVVSARVKVLSGR